MICHLSQLLLIDPKSPSPLSMRAKSRDTWKLSRAETITDHLMKLFILPLVDGSRVAGSIRALEKASNRDSSRMTIKRIRQGTVIRECTPLQKQKRLKEDNLNQHIINHLRIGLRLLEITNLTSKLQIKRQNLMRFLITILLCLTLLRGSILLLGLNVYNMLKRLSRSLTLTKCLQLLIILALSHSRIRSWLTQLKPRCGKVATEVHM